MDAERHSRKMTEIAGLASEIADRILEQHEAGISIPPVQFRMFVSAARMLLDNGLPWPPSVEHLVLEVERRVEEIEADLKGGVVKSIDERVKRLMLVINEAKRRIAEGR